MLTINHISFLRTKKVPYERAKYFFNPGLIIKWQAEAFLIVSICFIFFRIQDDRLQWWKSSKTVWRQFWLRAWRADLASDAFGKSSAGYGQIDKNGYFVRKFEWNLGWITDKQFQNSTLSVIPSRRTNWAAPFPKKIVFPHAEIKEIPYKFNRNPTAFVWLFV